MDFPRMNMHAKPKKLPKQRKKLLRVKKVNKEDKVIELLEELVKWTKVTSIPHVKKILLEILSSPEEKTAYQSSDGKTREEVAIHAYVGHTTVGRWWKKWIKAGIARPVSVQRGTRAKRVFSLDDFSIEVPAIEKEVVEEDKGENERER